MWHLGKKSVLFKVSSFGGTPHPPTWSTMPSRAERRVGWRSRRRCMILLHLHREAGALIGTGSPAAVWAEEED